MEWIRNCLLILCIPVILFTGCHPQTTVILPPESTIPTTVPTTIPTTAPATAPSTEAATAPATEPATEPTAAPTSASTTEPTSTPTTEPTTSANLSDHVIGSLEREILTEINRRRSTDDVPELSIKKRLSAMAAIRARECVQKRDSTRPDGRNWSSVLTDHGSTGWDHKAEIRLYCSKGLPADILVETWMSTETAANHILSPNFRQCGIGVATSGSTVYIVVIFVG